MKKILELAAVSMLILAIAGLIRHYEMNKEIGDLLKTVAQRIAPWMNTDLYS